MATPSKTQIANAALALLGSTRRISDMSEGSETANLVLACWDAMVRTLLADHPWNFAIQRKMLNASATAPTFGEAYAYELPADCLRWLPPGEDDIEFDAWFEGRQEGTAILTDAAAPLPVRYISAEWAERINRWPPHFVTATEFALAARLAEPVTQSSSVAEKMAEEAEIELRRAKRRDGQASGTRRRIRVSRGSNWLKAQGRPFHPGAR